MAFDVLQLRQHKFKNKENTTTFKTKRQFSNCQTLLINLLIIFILYIIKKRSTKHHQKP